VDVIRTSFATVAREFGITEENAPGFTAFSTTAARLERQWRDEKRRMAADFEGDRVVGFYSLLWQAHDECELNHLCVLPAYRHKGIGTALLENAFQTAQQRNCKKMNLAIVEENRILRTWYERHGFAHTGTKKFSFFPFTCGYMTKTL
jgi:ribosomal protein S18 acetylase RimI-like enzyme